MIKSLQANFYCMHNVYIILTGLIVSVPYRDNYSKFSLLDSSPSYISFYLMRMNFLYSFKCL